MSINHRSANDINCALQALVDEDHSNELTINVAFSNGPPTGQEQNVLQVMRNIGALPKLKQLIKCPVNNFQVTRNVVSFPLQTVVYDMEAARKIISLTVENKWQDRRDPERHLQSCDIPGRAP